MATIIEGKKLAKKIRGNLKTECEELKKQARLLLEKKGYIVDSPFEGDFERWIGVYARPKDKPTYLDPTDGEEAGLQELYSVATTTNIFFFPDILVFFSIFVPPFFYNIGLLDYTCFPKKNCVFYHNISSTLHHVN